MKLPKGILGTPGSITVPSLGAGVKSTGSTSIAIPAGIAGGKYYIVVVADDGNAVSEIYETNNTTYRQITIH